MTPLSEHFSLEELTVTAHRGVDNTPPAAVVEHLRALAEGLERVRALLGHPLHVTSGYRSALLNRLVGGSASSAHMAGWAADFICPPFGPPIEVCRAIAGAPDKGDGELAFDQLIQEGGWVHLSFAPALRRQVLTKRPGGGYREGL